MFWPIDQLEGNEKWVSQVMAHTAQNSTVLEEKFTPGFQFTVITFVQSNFAVVHHP